MNFYSKHHLSDGRWEVTVTVTSAMTGYNDQDLTAAIRQRVDSLYQTDAQTIAVTLLQELLGAVRVEVGGFCGPKFIASKE
jgi:hypothetical protein